MYFTFIPDGMEVTGQCRKEFVAMLRCMLDSLLTAERESEKVQSYKPGTSQMKRLREIVGALLWPLVKALTQDLWRVMVTRRE